MCIYINIKYIHKYLCVSVCMFICLKGFMSLVQGWCEANAVGEGIAKFDQLTSR